MTKCDFCTESANGKCHWSTQAMRRDYCEKAIKKMINCLNTAKKTK